MQYLLANLVHRHIKTAQRIHKLKGVGGGKRPLSRDVSALVATEEQAAVQTRHLLGEALILCLPPFPLSSCQYIHVTVLFLDLFQKPVDKKSAFYKSELLAKSFSAASIIWWYSAFGCANKSHGAAG